MPNLFTLASALAAYPVATSIMEFMLPRDALPRRALRYNWYLIGSAYVALACACVVEIV